MAEGNKHFTNRTGKDVRLTIFIREGDSPEDEGGTEVYDLSKDGPGSEIDVIYIGEAGSLGYVYLNALLVEFADGSRVVGVSQRVGERGDAWDDVLNTNSTITLDAATAGTLQATGSN